MMAVRLFRCAEKLTVLGMLALAVTLPASARTAASSEVDSGDASAQTAVPRDLPPVRLQGNKKVRVHYGRMTPRADLPSGQVRYRRFTVAEPGRDLKISVRVISEKHDGRPRFTVFSPQLVILDRDGQIRRIVSLNHLQLDIRPFRATRLRECVVVKHLQGFLLASDPGRLGDLYQFNASPSANGHPDHGFYRPRTPMKVFLTYANSGPVEVEVSPAPKEGSACRAVPD